MERVIKRIIGLFVVAFIVCGFGEMTVYAEQIEQPAVVTEKLQQNISVENEIVLTIGDTYQLKAESDGDGDITYEAVEPGMIEISEEGLITACAAGECSVKVSASETEIYNSSEVFISVKVVKKDWEIAAKDIKIKYGNKDTQIQFENPTENEPVYEVADTKVITVSEKGYVKPQKIGKTTVHIKVKGNAEYNGAECKIKVEVKTNLSKPVLLKVENNGKVILRWKKIEGCDGYYIYQKIGDGKFKRIKTIKNPNVLEYEKDNAVIGGTYTYRIRAYSDNGENKSAYSYTKAIVFLLRPEVKLSRIGNSVQIKWTQVEGTSGYYIYRKSGKNGEWEEIKQITENDKVLWTDNNPKQGMTNYYRVDTYKGKYRGRSSTSKAVYFLESPAIKSISGKSGSSVRTVKWVQNSTASGYQLQYADNSLFLGAKSITLKKNDWVSRKIKGLSKGKVYYARIRAYKKVNGKTYYSDWALSANAKETEAALYTSIKKKGKAVEIKKLCKQKLGKYDTVQGGCTDGKYVYYALYDRTVENCKIAKIRLSDMKVIKVSKVLEIAHGNDITYNSKTKKLVVVHTRVNEKRISVINSSTLKVEKYLDIKIPKKMAGVSTEDLEEIIGFNGIAYNAKRDQYVLFYKNAGDFLILNKNFKPVSYVKASEKSGATKQGVDITDDYIMTYHSSAVNIIMVYTWDGQFVKKINVRKKYEIENVFHVGKQFYATFYEAYYGKNTYRRNNIVYKINGF